MKQNILYRIIRKLSHLRVMDRRHIYKYWEIEHLKKIVAYYQVDCFFDVGANYGQYATMLRKDVGFEGLIVSFEPNLDAASHLLKLSKNDPLWQVEQGALSSFDGVQQFNIMADSQFSSLSQPTHSETDLFIESNKVKRTVDVKCETVTTAYERLSQQHRFKYPFLKMDTQGYDVEIMRHAGGALGHFIGIQSELAIKKLYENSIDYKSAIEFYETLGFSMSAFVPNNSGHFPYLVETDCIMVRGR